MPPRSASIPTRSPGSSSSSFPIRSTRRARPLPTEPAPRRGRQVGRAPTALRLKLADTPTPFVHGRLLTGMRQRWAAVACDGGIVVAIALCVFIACDKFWLPLGVAMLAYYLGGILLLGNTPGVCLLAPARPAARTTIDPPMSPTRESGTAHPSWHFRMPAR